MTVKVKFLAYFRDLFGAREKEVKVPEGADLHQLLKLLCDSAERKEQVFSGTEEINPDTVILKNGSPVSSAGGLNAPLAGGDVVAIFPYLGGG
jgi:MoaD family protein